MPQVMFMLGPKASGKTTIANKMADRTNMKVIDFNNFIHSNGLEGQDDETITQLFIASLIKERAQRIILENFPKNQYQAKYFLRNGAVPSNVFCLSCSKDVCQERMIDLGENHPNYVPSSILSKHVKEFHDNAAALMPYLKDNTNFCGISTDQDVSKSLDQIYKIIEPCIINVRGGKSHELQEEIIVNLCENHDFINLDVMELMNDEMQRGTNIGQDFIKLVKQDKNIPASLIVKMLKKIVYCGQP